MLSFYNIFTVARFEMKTLLRSWFFRIFAGLSVSILIFLNIGMFTSVGNSSWELRGIPASLPYMNILLLNVVQAIIGVFLASDFLKRDKKLDTTEVVYMRSMTNGDYVLGKSMGILIIFIALNALVLLITGVFNIFFADVPVRFAAYLYYPLLISLPTLVFIFGLSFLFMVVIRNQAVTFIVLLGYIGLTLFFLSNQWHFIFDYMAFNLPLMYSDFVGFGNLGEILLHRGIYLLLGLSFIFATILLIKRLPQSIFMQRFSLIVTIVFLCGGIFLAGTYLSRISAAGKARREMAALNNQFGEKPRVTLTDCDLELIHQGKRINGRAGIIFKNETDKPIEEYVFSLNPGLTIDRILYLKGELEFQRNWHLVSVKPSAPLLPQSSDSLTISYRGVIDEEAAYLDVEKKDREKSYKAEMYNIDKRYAFITPDYVLLSPEMMWYPSAGVGYQSDHPEYHPVDFIRFTLKVTTNEDLTVLSQGELMKHEGGQFTYIPEYPLPQISLTIGAYEDRSISVDSVDYRLFTLRNHDYFVPFFNELDDTLGVLISDLKQDFENQLELSYAYHRVTLVEVPVQFTTYQRDWTVGMETVQPEIVFLPENGILLQRADFKQAARWEKRRMERFSQVTTPAESQARTFTRFIRETLLSDGGMGGFRRGRGGPSVTPMETSYSLFPNYYTFVNQLRSERWPILNVALESYLKQRTENEMMQAMRGFFLGLTDQEKTNLALTDHTLVEVLANPEKKDLIPHVIKSKGDYLFSLIQSQVGTEIFESLLKEILSSSKFRVYDTEELIQILKERFELDFEPIMDEWYNSRTLPGFLLSDVQSYKILDGNRTRFQVKVTATNPEPTAGLLTISFRTGGGGRGGGGGNRGGGMFGGSDTDIERIIPFAAKQTKEVGFVLDAQPRMMTINTMISRNLPSISTERFEEMELNNKAAPFDGEKILPYLVQKTESHEIIVDNEDPGFTAVNPTSESKLKKLLKISSSDEDEKYSGMRFWRPPTKWVATTGSDFYGEMVQSAHYTRAGKGERKAVWTAILPESGQYEVYTYIYKMRRMGRRGGRDNNEESDEQYHFNIFHDDGSDETLLSMKNAENGWNFLGGFYFSADSARVELTNESPGRVVVADAVKWVKQ